jgi:hypothetical protein
VTTRVLLPDVLPEAQTFTYISDFVQVVDYDPILGTNTVVAIDNVSNISYSVGQPNVSISVGDNKIWFNGSYTTGNTDNIMYFEPPDGNDIKDQPTISFSYGSVPPQKFVYKVNQPEPEGVTVTHTMNVSYNGGGNGVFTIDRFVYPSIYTAYTFLLNYDYYDGG